MHSAASLHSHPLSVYFVCLFNKVYNKQEAWFLLYFVCIMSDFYLTIITQIYWIKIDNVLLVV